MHIDIIAVDCYHFMKYDISRMRVMGNMTVRNLPDAVHEKLREQAGSNGRSLEAEVRSILVQSVIASSSGGVGDRLRQRFDGCFGDELSVERDRSASKPGLFD